LALGQLYLKDQRYTSAQQVFAQVIRIEEKPKLAYIELGKTYQALNQFDAARDAFFKAAAIDPADVEPLFLAGQLYLRAKQPSEARQQFQRVLRVNKDYPLVNYYIGKAALSMGSTSEAIEQANIEKSKNPGLADPYILAADAYTELKQYGACAGEYRKAVELRPADSNMYVKMARCYRMSGNLDAALSMINQAGIQESGNPEVWKEQGAIFEMRQDTLKAIEAYNQYLTIVPNAIDRAQIEMRINALSQ
ncbi:MAG: tetratricopeptide repeat protein, partial [Bdellovibrionales bacterium]|nr:tetratricopeptide repeat protein [Bdellovibrionales bacterium]